jgi:hypothetical protein
LEPSYELFLLCSFTEKKLGIEVAESEVTQTAYMIKLGKDQRPRLHVPAITPRRLVYSGDRKIRIGQGSIWLP